MAFNVEQSLMKARWVLPDADVGAVERIVRKYGLSEIVARLLVLRDVPEEGVESFMSPTLAKDFPDPSSMMGMKALAEDLAEAIDTEKSIGVFGDFDVDGATSSAVLKRFFRYFGLEVPVYIPDRTVEGYGPNIEAFSKLRAQGVDFLLVCDCGTTSHSVIEAGEEMGLRVAILDHHQAEETLPKCAHVVNPKRLDDESGLDMLAAVGVCFMVCVATNTALRARGYYERSGKKEMPLKTLMDIVALGTVCDMVPLKGVNRLLVRNGFEQVPRSDNIGLKALMNVARLPEGEMNAYSCGFVLGPRINAGSRVHKADLGAKLLATLDVEEATNISWTLNDCNDKRKDIQAEMQASADRMIEAQGLDQYPCLFVTDENGHPGLSGLVAGQLKEKYKKPCCYVSFAKGNDFDLEGRGSGRSVAGVNLAAAFIDARSEGLLIKGGGHAMAGGFTVLPEKIEAFREYLFKHIENQLAGKTCVSETKIDGVLSVSGARLDMVKMLHEKVGPFGQGHEEPLFALPNVKVSGVDIVGDGHVKCFVSDWEGGSSVKAIAFRAADNDLGQAMLKNNGSVPMNLVGHLKVNAWNGRESVEMHIQDGSVII